MSHILIIHDIRSVHNVGALFRTADSVGISRIIISGYSPTPLERFGSVRSDMAKSALGAELSVPWEYSENIFEKIAEYKKNNYNSKYRSNLYINTIRISFGPSNFF